MTDMKEIEGKGTSNKRRIKVCKNGPYLVSGKISLIKQIICTDKEGNSIKWQTSNNYPLKDSYTLCRCGQSKEKPFCDGSHVKVNFNGFETSSREPYIKRAKEIVGPTLKLTDDESLCASARFCHRASGIWNLISQDGQEAARIAIEEAGDCPSGTLALWDKKSGKAIEPEFEQSIALVEDPHIGVSGPIWVRGGIPIESADGTIYEIRNRVALCRCGKSSNKPFCDSSHYPE